MLKCTYLVYLQKLHYAQGPRYKSGDLRVSKQVFIVNSDVIADAGANEIAVVSIAIFPMNYSLLLNSVGVTFNICNSTTNNLS